MDGEPQLVNTHRAATILGVSHTALAVMRMRNKGPAWVRLGRSVRYDIAELRDYIRRNTHKAGTPCESDTAAA